ncbi:MAG: aminoacyl-tRNA hydrolase [Lachnospiraceae bacterium]|nr:aminoacyl-tRNA hydrolase [Lachnospiraceae bacterium]
MFIIAGLGNPTAKYEHSRHNVGFDTLDILAEKYQIKMGRSLFRALVGKGVIEGKKVLLVKPLTYMNLSGTALRPITRFYKADPARDLIVIYDDVDLDIGKIRVRAKGSAGSHNGMKNIVEQLGTTEFARVRVGIGKRPEQMDMVNFVLSRFPEEERESIKGAMENAAEAVVTIIKEGCDRAMNQFN